MGMVPGQFRAACGGSGSWSSSGWANVAVRRTWRRSGGRRRWEGKSEAAAGAVGLGRSSAA